MTRGIILRKATKKDSRDIWTWRNHPGVRKNCFNKRSVPWKEHQNWFYSKIRNANARVYVASKKKSKIGVIRFEAKEDDYNVSINLNPEFFGKGFGSQIIKLGTEKILSGTKNKRPITAKIKKNNIASRKAFSKAGYECLKKTGKAAIYEKK